MKGIKKKKRVSEDAPVRGGEDDRLDAAAFTEIDAHAGQGKTAAKQKKSFVGGLKKAKEAPTLDDNPLRLYPGPDQPWNISGSDKVASAAMMAPPATSARGANPTLKTMASPKRVTPDLGPYGAPKGTSGVTGVSNTQPFQHSYGKFGRNPRKALKSITRLKRGM